MVRVAAIKFREAGKLYDFNAGTLELKQKDRVVVETDRGRALGTVVVPPYDTPRNQGGPELKNIVRKATDEDLALAQKHAEQEEEAFRFCMARIQERRMPMKLVQAEYLFDGSKIVFYFTADGRVDFRELVKDLAHHFHTRIEMRQIGVRDEAKMTGGIGICGRELCCCTFLRDFNPVSVKMAKEQGLALNPNKISGQCGRLLCCLEYEYETYGYLKRGLPKVGRKVTLDGRVGEVTSIDIFKQKAKVRFENGEDMQVSGEEIRSGEVAAKAEKDSAKEEKPAPSPEKPAAAQEPSKQSQPRREPRSDKEEKGKGSDEGRKPRRRSRGRRGKDGTPTQPREGQTKPAAKDEQKPPQSASQDKGKDAREQDKKRRRPRRRSRSKKPSQGDKQ